MSWRSPLGRRRTSAALFGLSFILVVVTGPILYVSTVIDDEDAFVAVADRVVDQAEVRRAIAGEVTELTFEALEADETIADLLPDEARTFAVPLTAIASEELTTAAFALLDTDIAVEARGSALREVHRQLTTDDDAVVIDLGAVVVRTSREVAGPAIGAGVAKVLSGSDRGRITLAEPDSSARSLLASVRGVPTLGWSLLLAAVVTFALAIVASNDRRRGLVVGGLVVSAAAIASTLLVSVVLFALLATRTESTAIGQAIVEVVSTDFAQQQRGTVINGLVLSSIGMLLGNRPAAVALRRLPGDLWNRRARTLDAVAGLIRDNPPLARIVTWVTGLFVLLSWTAPTWRVILTILGVTGVAQTLIWIVVGNGERAERLRSSFRIHATTDRATSAHDDSIARRRVNVAVLTAIIFLLWPGWGRTTVATCFVIAATVQAAIDLPAARRLARAEAEEESDGQVIAEPGARRTRFLLAAAAAIGVFVVGAVLTTSSVDRVEASTACNGHVDLCDRRVDEVVFAGSHNSMSSSDLGWDLALQTGDMVTQLDHGIRALLIDAHYWDDEGMVEGGDDPAARAVIEAALSDDQPRPGTWLCHGFCALGATELTTGLADIDLWLDSHPREIVIVIVQDEIGVDDLTDAFDASGLRKRVHVHRTGTPFPTLQELIDTEERLLVYTENAGEPNTWLQNGYADNFTETPFTFALRSDFTCTPNRGDDDNPLFLLNHWLTTGIPVREVAAAVNSRTALLARMKACESERGRLPTVIATDFVQTGDLTAVVAELNQVADRTP